MSRFDRAIQQGLAATKRVAGVSVTYRRGPRTIAITAIPAERRDEIETGDGLELRAFARDWLIDAADLVFDGEDPSEPHTGDAIEHDGSTWELSPLAAEQLPWRWHDRGRTRYRVHTVES